MNSTFHRSEASRSYFTKAEATAMQGKVVGTNAGQSVTIDGMAAMGKNKYVVIAGGHDYHKSAKSGLYCWLPENNPNNL